MSRTPKRKKRYSFSLLRLFQKRTAVPLVSGLMTHVGPRESEVLSPNPLSTPHYPPLRPRSFGRSRTGIRRTRPETSEAGYPGTEGPWKGLRRI